jgi:hypothetical protein
MNKRIPPVYSSSSWKPERGPTWPDSNPSFEAIGTSPFDTDKAAWNLGSFEGGEALPLSFCPTFRIKQENIKVKYFGFKTFAVLLM